MLMTFLFLSSFLGQLQPALGLLPFKMLPVQNSPISGTLGARESSGFNWFVTSLLLILYVWPVLAMVAFNNVTVFFWNWIADEIPYLAIYNNYWIPKVEILRAQSSSLTRARNAGAHTI